MNLDDPSRLSAYLDDELDQGDRQAVGWSVDSDPALAEQLRSLSRSKDLVANLDRPTIPRDLAPDVLRLIRPDRSRRVARVAVAALGFAGFTTIAACLTLALILLFQSLHETPDRPAVVLNDPTPPPSPTRTHTADPAAKTPAAESSNVAIRSLPPAGPTVQVVEKSSPVEGVEQTSRRMAKTILGRNPVRRVVIVSEAPDAAEEIARLIARNGRETPEFARISLSPGDGGDPDRRESAEVFAVPIDDRGRQSLVDRLRKAYADVAEEGSRDSDQMLRLSDLGRVAILEGLKAAPLGEPPREFSAGFANRADDSTGPIVGAERQPVGSVSAGSGPAASASLVEATGDVVRPSPLLVGPPDPYRTAALKPGDQVTLLIWVTRPAP